jgi:hypothetical protein
MQALAQSIHHFVRLAEQYRAIDQEIRRMECGLTPIARRALKEARKTRLMLKDDIANLLARSGRRALEPLGISRT